MKRDPEGLQIINETINFEAIKKEIKIEESEESLNTKEINKYISNKHLTKMTKEETWKCWLLDAIHKLRFQKQRANVYRISACIRMHHSQYTNETVEKHLEQCVKNGSISKVINKGLTSYRDPGSAPGRGFKTLHITGCLILRCCF